MKKLVNHCYLLLGWDKIIMLDQKILYLCYVNIVRSNLLKAHIMIYLLLYINIQFELTIITSFNSNPNFRVDVC